ncbi:MAG: DUF177 domain-containing protein [Bacillota bacterium]|nr:DUF177 domain-containing protein [Bacillota bacterium]
MKVNLKRLKTRPEAREAFSFVFDDFDSNWKELAEDFLDPVQLDLIIENTGKVYRGKGHLKTTVQLLCGRCVKAFAFPIVSELDISMVEDDYSQDCNHVEDFIVFSGDEVDITARVQEQIFLSIPMNPLCSLECKGLCPICGNDKNTGNCSCEEREIDPRWEKLKNLI